MEKKVLKAVLASAFIFAIVINLSVNQKSQKHDVSLVMKNIEALADGEGGTECTRECQDEKCDVTWDPNDRCRVKCGSTNCSFVAAIKKT